MNYIFNSYDATSKLTYKDIGKHDTTTNGRVKSTIIGKLQVQLTLIHKVDTYNKTNFETFFNTNKNALINVEYGEVVYSLHFSSNPIYTPLNGGLWKITTKFTGLA